MPAPQSSDVLRQLGDALVDSGSLNTGFAGHLLGLVDDALRYIGADTVEARRAKTDAADTRSLWAVS